MDETKTEVAWIFASERPEPVSGSKHLRWRDITRKFDIHVKST